MELYTRSKACTLCVHLVLFSFLSKTSLVVLLCDLTLKKSV